ncbi:MAG: serine protease [Spirochaetes bacterium]|nr:serine protease [Spirochaetota bacterium]
MKTRKITACACLLLLLAGSLVTALDSDSLERIVTGVVLVYPVEKDALTGKINVVQSGSGTLIDKKQGLILTNFHVVDKGDGQPFPYAIICVSLATDEPPKEAFFAEFVNGDSKLDIALLKYKQDYPKSKINLSMMNALDWKGAKTWKSAKDLKLSDELIIIGYPDYGMGTVTITKGNVAGFSNDDASINFARAWIKTDAKLSSGNSGGTAVDTNGKFVGIPTGVLSGHVASNMGLLRAVDLAEILVEGKGPTWVEKVKASQSVSVSNPVFATKVDADEGPANAGTNFGPSNALYFYFDYSGMKDGSSCRLNWVLDGNKIGEASFKWEGGTSGTYRFKLECNDGSDLPFGSYKAEFYVDGSKKVEGGATLAAAANPKEGVICKGKIIWADTGKPAAKAFIIFLKPNVKIADFIKSGGNQSSIVASGVADKNGNFATSPALERGKKYPIIIAHENGAGIGSDDGVSVGKSQASPWDLGVIELPVE